MRTALRIFLLASLFSVSGGISFAQIGTPVATGTPPFGSFGGGPVDTINLANLNAHVTIPVLSKAGRGIPFVYNLSYDSLIWTPVSSSGSTTWAPTGAFGWAFLGVGQMVFTGAPVGYYGIWAGTVTYIEPQGTPHYLGYWVGGTGYCSGSGTAMDGSGYSFLMSATFCGDVTVTAKNGETVNNSSGLLATDSNGNQITINSSGVITDTLGQTALTATGTPPSNTTFTYTAPSGAGAPYTMKYAPYTVKTNFACSGVSEYGPTAQNLVSEIDLPDGTKYTFAYETTLGYSGDVTGRLASVTLPTGGTIYYTYTGGNSGIECADGSTAGLTRQTPDGTWTYARTLGTSPASTTTITDPQNNQTVMNFQGIYQTEAQVYQGSISGTLLETTYTCYNNATSPCNSTAITLPITQQTQIVQWPGTGGLQSKTSTTYNSYGSVTERDEYAYGTGAPGAVVRKTLTTYASLGNGIVGRPATVTVEDGSNNVKSKTTYTYDQGTVTATSGTLQHVSVTGSRGNPTTISYLVSGSTTLSKTFTYYDTGNVNVATDFNGAPTTYAYGSGSCGNSFATSISEPLNLSASTVWNCIGGVRTQVTDENGQSITKAYTDGYFWRPSSVTDKSGAVTSYAYTAAGPSNPASAESTLPFNSGNSTVDVLSTLDSLGRGLLQQTRQAPGATTFDSVETDYDSLGRPARVTLPYSGASSQTNASAPATLVTYDALGRILKQIDGGGGYSSFVYTQNDSLATVGPAPTGENTKQQQFEYDALGRLTSVCEITNTLPGNGACAQTAPATGYWTKYTYDLNNNLTGVTQNAQSSGTQVRTYTYDDMGRMTSETNPETGATTYTYDTDTTCGTSNGDLVKRVDAVGNTTCYTYDALHRITSATYTGPYAANTPAKHYVYDSATVNGAAMPMVKTRMAEAYTCFSPCTSKKTDIGLGYSARGEATDVYESTLNSGGYYHTNEIYWANGVPAQLNQLVGLPTINYGVDGEGRPNSTLAGSGQNPVTNVSYGTFSLPTQVSFGSNDSDTFVYDPSTARMTNYQFSINGQSVTGTLTWNANSTLQGLGITDPFNSSDNQSCTYSYDDLTRIGSNNCGSGWSQTFSYDAFGNINKSGTSSFQPTYSYLTNHMTQIGSSSPTYDSNGNVTNDFLHTYAWDAENAPVTVDNVSLTYDALGHVVEQNRSGVYTQVVYAPSGEKLALMSGQSLQKAFVPLPAGATAIYSGSGLSCYRHPDWLGSSRLDSTPSRTVSSGTAYGPFGETYAPYGGSDPSFTGKNQDTVSNLYDFPAREYNGIQGRWASPDPAGLSAADPTAPQSWNRYAYVTNDPLDATDPSGTCTIFIGGVKDNQNDKNALSQLAKKVGGLYVAPYSGQSTLGAILNIAAQDLAGANASSQTITDALNSIVNDPNGIQIVAFSGGAQAFSTAVDSGSVGNLASGGPLSSINTVVYLSPGIGPNTNLAFRDSSFTQVYHGSGLVDFAATFFARLSGQAGTRLSGASGHHSKNVDFINPALLAHPYSRCVLKFSIFQFRFVDFGPEFPFWFDACFNNVGDTWWACPPPGAE